MHQLERFKYMAFISYRHADNTEEDRQWATWLHQQLETYEVPSDLIGTKNLRGETIPERIYPVFRDEVSLPANADLASAIQDALDDSQFLIVLCSPRAVQSRYVAEEILHFKKSGKAERIMAGILLGEPNASIDDAKVEDPEDVRTLECFPKPLQYHVDHNGALDLNQQAEPIAANFRLPDGNKGLTSASVYERQLLEAGGDKKLIEKKSQAYEAQLNTAKLKIIAGILGVALERLIDRDKHYQLIKVQAQNRKFRKIAFIMSTLAILALASAGFAYYHYQKSQQLLDLTAKQINFLNFEVRDALKDHAPTNIRVPIMQQLDQLLNQLNTHDVVSDASFMRDKAIALSQKADLILQSDGLNPAEAKLLYQKAHAIFKELTVLDPTNTQFQRDVSISHEKLGDLALRLGDTASAQTHYAQALTKREKLVALDPTNTQFQRDVSISHQRLGDLALRLGDTASAQTHYAQALTVAEKLVALDPTNTQFQRDVSISHNKLGELALRLGDPASAQTHYEQDLSVAENLVALDPTNTQFQRDVSVSHEKLGELALRLGDPASAQTHYAQALTKREKLVALDPTNTQFQRDVSISHNKLGDLALRLGDTASAQTHYEQDLSVAENLVALDTTNTQFQRDVLVSHNKLGDLAQKLGEIKAALHHYRLVLLMLDKMAGKGLSPSDIAYKTKLKSKIKSLEASNDRLIH